MNCAGSYPANKSRNTPLVPPSGPEGIVERVKHAGPEEVQQSRVALIAAIFLIPLHAESFCDTVGDSQVAALKHTGEELCVRSASSQVLSV
jgi:hypothetical protein